MSQLFFAAASKLAGCPNHPRRYYGTSELHCITCSCYHRQPWLASVKRRDLFLSVFEAVRQRYGFVVVGYVVMPEHIHLLISEPEKGDPWRVMQADQTGLRASRLEVRFRCSLCLARQPSRPCRRRLA